MRITDFRNREEGQREIRVKENAGAAKAVELRGVLEAIQALNVADRFVLICEQRSGGRRIVASSGLSEDLAPGNGWIVSVLERAAEKLKGGKDGRER